MIDLRVRPTRPIKRMRPRPVLHETEAETKTSYCETETIKLVLRPQGPCGRFRDSGEDHVGQGQTGEVYSQECTSSLSGSLEADLGMLSIFDRAGAPTKRGPHERTGNFFAT